LWQNPTGLATFRTTIIIIIITIITSRPLLLFDGGSLWMGLGRPGGATIIIILPPQKGQKDGILSRHLPQDPTFTGLGASGRRVFEQFEEYYFYSYYYYY
jgi:hypothetical protein